MSLQPPTPGPPSVPPAGSLRCPRCSATVGPDQDWCLECGAPARTRLAPTPNWQLPTVALGAVMLIAGALFAFAFVRLTDDNNAPATTPTAVTTTVAAPAVVPPVVAPPVVPPATQTPPATGATGTTATGTGTVPATTVANPTSTGQTTTGRPTSTNTTTNTATATTGSRTTAP